MRLLIILVSVYLLGFIVFTLQARFEDYALWDNGYFIWQSLCYGSVGTWAYIFHKGDKEERSISRWVYFLSYLLFAWEIISGITGWNINNEVAVFIGYLAFLGVTTYLVFREIIRIYK